MGGNIISLLYYLFFIGGTTMSNPASPDRRRILSKASIHPIAILIVLFVLSFMVACSSDSGGGGGSEGIDGTWAGKAASSYGINIAFTAKITESNTKISGTITIPFLSFTDEPITGTLNGSNISFGDISGVITFTGTISGSSASGTYNLPSYSDTGSWTATHQ
jgi:hypothetical protein